MRTTCKMLAGLCFLLVLATVFGGCERRRHVHVMPAIQKAANQRFASIKKKFRRPAAAEPDANIGEDLDDDGLQKPRVVREPDDVEPDRGNGGDFRPQARATGAVQNAPAPGEKYPSWTVTGFGQTVQDAEANALDEAGQKVAEYLAAYHPALAWTPPGYYLKQHHMVGIEGEPTDKRLGDAGTVKEIRLRVEVTPQLLADAPLMARHERMQERQHVLIVGLAAAVGALLVLGGYLRLEEATGGYSRLLRVAVAAALAALGAGFWLLR